MNTTGAALQFQLKMGLTREPFYRAKLGLGVPRNSQLKQLLH